MQQINLNKIKKCALISVLILVGLAAGIASIWFLTMRNKSQIFQQPDKEPAQETNYGSGIIQLPEPLFDGKVSVEKALLNRRSIRDYKNEPLTLAEISQLLWAAQGITNQAQGFRSSPSAGAIYPLEVYIVAGNVDALIPGIYKYKPQNHQLLIVKEGDKREEVYRAALEQSFVRDAAIVLIFSAVYKRTTEKYGERGIRYVHIEVGHAAQNVYLQAVSLDLGTVVIGAFSDSEVKKIINMPDEEEPLYIMPVGKRRN